VKPRAVVVLAVVLAAALGACRAGAIGVDPCDDYLTKADACAKRGGIGAVLTMSNEMLTKSWKKSAADGKTRAALPNQCKAALEGAKKAYTACDW
jgi:hypothetical protein